MTTLPIDDILDEMHQQASDIMTQLLNTKPTFNASSLKIKFDMDNHPEIPHISSLMMKYIKNTLFNQEKIVQGIQIGIVSETSVEFRVDLPHLLIGTPEQTAIFKISDPNNLYPLLHEKFYAYMQAKIDKFTQLIEDNHTTFEHIFKNYIIKHGKQSESNTSDEIELEFIVNQAPAYNHIEIPEINAKMPQWVFIRMIGLQRYANIDISTNIRSSHYSANNSDVVKVTIAP